MGANIVVKIDEQAGEVRAARRRRSLHPVHPGGAVL